MLPAEHVLDPERAGIVGQIGGSDGDFSVTAGHVEHVGRLSEAGEAAAQGLHQRLTLGDRDPEVARAAHQVGMGVS